VTCERAKILGTFAENHTGRERLAS